MIGIAISGTALVAGVHESTMNTIGADIGHIAAISDKFELSPAADSAAGSAADPCDGQPQIKLSQPLRSNLGYTGPGTGDEGVVFPGEYMNPGHANQKVLVVVNATNHTGGNLNASFGGKGYEKYALIKQDSANTHVQLNFKIVDQITREPVKIPKLDITFFEFTQTTHGEEKVADYIKIKRPHQYFLTKFPAVNVNEGNDGYLTFKANRHWDFCGWAGQSSHSLTVAQKNKAVTFRYIDVDNFDVEMGKEGPAGTGWFSGWQFLFVFRPALHCVRTSDADATIVPGFPETKNETNKCLFTIPIVNWCFPKFW